MTLKILIVNLLLFSVFTNQNKNKMEIATFGGGCFWCTEAVFKELKGVESVTSGYSGGHVINPAYREVTSGKTGHAEVIEIEFDPAVISFQELLEVFWAIHDPTTLNRQGADVGPQYRSVIFYHNEAQKEIAEKIKQKLNDEKVFDKPVVTEITPWENFYRAENYHQDYYENNPNQGYCQFVIVPKLDKFRKIFQDKLK
ncbi:peptide methionine sulfoxide reductase [Sunxiuqinia dokdonensis]|uniref:Peptide methionine sulfoxide reductase MsrA n=2 Tax=Sunxiuqinia dokdonensis TaxID=1409788 RepID=A0A0L8VCD3_9BACT|nr:peptide methionine sulfoxide reductase [Sunxiuqinia dokdonensis]